MDSPQFFEALMILCFGVSWPAEIWKTWTTKTVKGISALFLWFVFAGYLSGILFKYTSVAAGGSLSPVTALYILNTSMVGIELVLFYRYRGRLR
jgi:hypothetical protein